VHLTTVQEVW